MFVSESSLKKMNNYALYINMTLKIVKYQKVLTQTKMSLARFRFVSLKEFFILRKKPKHQKST